MLQQTFLHLLRPYTNDEDFIHELWREIEQNYSDEKRYYHTLIHLENLLVQLTEIKSKIEHWETIVFTLFYHDIVYNALNSDNEEKSALLAEKRMRQLAVPEVSIQNCVRQIIATKSHETSSDMDTNFFTDADLSILGQPSEIYSAYTKNVRQEYSIYPDLVYNPGRKKVLNHFLAMKRIYKTTYFFEKFEAQAKLNLVRELDTLT